MSDLFQHGMIDRQRKRPPVDPDAIRRTLIETLEQAKAARDAPPWDRRKFRYHEVVFPQMSRWLPNEEAEALVREFRAELARIEPMLAA